MKSFAIVIVCYNRLGGIKRLVSSLEKVDYCGRNDINLIFSIDYSGTSEVEDFADSYDWEFGQKSVRTFKENQGLKKHILSCGDFANEYDIVTILEDDIFVSDSFYSYAYNAAEFYYDDDRIGGISLYAYQKNWMNWPMRFEPQKNEYDAYFMRIAQSWGQVWTRPQWQNFKKWYDNNPEFIISDDIPQHLNLWSESSWLKFYCVYLIRTDRYFVYPYFGLSTDFSDAGVHNTDNSTDYQVELITHKQSWLFEKLDYQKSVVYDEYMNRMFLGSFVGVKDEELTNDINGTLNKKYYKRYVLSMESLCYEIVKSYKLCLRPIELSIINNLNGDDIFLYDTKNMGVKKNINHKKKRMVYSFRYDIFNDYYYRPTVKNFLKSFLNKVFRKLKIKK